MKTITFTRISKRGQVTLPAVARKALGVSLGDQLEVTITDSEVTYSKPRFTLESAFGSVLAIGELATEDIDPLIQKAKDKGVAARQQKLDQR